MKRMTAEELKAFQRENGRRSCRHRWGENAPTVALRVFAEDAAVLRSLCYRPARIVRELLQATEGTVWHIGADGRPITFKMEAYWEETSRRLAALRAAEDAAASGAVPGGEVVEGHGGEVGTAERGLTGGGGAV